MNDYMNDFVAYTSRYKPDFAQRIRGATDKEIATLERLAGRTLPETYVAYLARMGRGTGGLRPTVDASPHIANIIQHYELNGDDPEMFPPDSIVIGAKGVMTEEVCLQFVPPEVEPRVIISSGDEVEAVYAENLVKLLYRCAFAEYRQDALPHGAFYNCSFQTLGYRNVLGPATELAVSLGIAPLWFSDAMTVCAESSNVSLLVSQKAGSGMGMYVSASDPEDLNTVIQAFLRRFPLQPCPPVTDTYVPYGTEP